MNDVAALVQELIDAGASPAVAASVVTRAFLAGAQEAPPRRDSRQDRNARYYESHRDELKEKRLKTSESRLNSLNGLKASYAPPSPKDPVLPLSEPPEFNQTPPTPIAPPAKPKTDWPKDALEVWLKLYPRRVAPEAARKALEKVQRSGKVTFAGLCDATRRFAADPGCDPQFIPYPASWLNAGRFADERLSAPIIAEPGAMAPVSFDSPAYKPLLTRYRHEHGGADPPMNGKSAMLPADWVQASNEAVRRMQQ